MIKTITYSNIGKVIWIKWKQINFSDVFSLSMLSYASKWCVGWKPWTILKYNALKGKKTLFMMWWWKIWMYFSPCESEINKDSILRVVLLISVPFNYKGWWLLPRLILVEN